MMTRTKKKAAICVLAALVVLTVLAALFYYGTIKINTPSLERYPVRGVDVSEYQGDVDWAAIEGQGMSFAFIKATEGSGYTDPKFTSNWSNVEDTSIVCGAYHFFSFDSPAETQAENYIAAVDRRAGMLPPVVDIELYGSHKDSPPDADEVRAELTLLLDTLERHYGAKPIIYATQKSHSLYIAGHYPEYPLWIRDVYFTPSSVDWTFWQYTDKGNLFGYDGPEKHIDINVFRGDLPTLEDMCIQ